MCKKHSVSLKKLQRKFFFQIFFLRGVIKASDRKYNLTMFDSHSIIGQLDNFKKIEKWK